MSQLIYNMQSKTVLGLITLLVVVVGLELSGHLTPTAVDAIKWIGAAYIAQRAVATGTENMSGGPKA